MRKVQKSQKSKNNKLKKIHNAKTFCEKIKQIESQFTVIEKYHKRVNKMFSEAGISK